MSESAHRLPRAEPRYFGPGERPRFGWLHRPAPSAPTRDVGVVICNPFGYEALCSHRSLRHFAETAATLGFPAFRFDYDGTGDSAGGDLDPDRWRAWRTSTLDAVREVRRATGVARVCLLGVRLGATIAAAAAESTDDVAGLVLVAPVANGKLWLREMRALQAAMGRIDAPPALALPASVQESVGLLIDKETRAAITATELGEVAGRLPRKILLIDRSDRPPLTTAVERLRARGSHVAHVVLPGFVEMMLDPHFAVVPGEMLAAFGSWLAEHFPPGPAPGVAAVAERRTPDPVIVAPGVEEGVHFLDDAQRLFGVVSAPAGTRPTRAVLLLNAGANHHIGSGRLSVKFARRLASRGWLVLRYDISGIGDSLPHAGAPENEVYTPHAVEDLGVALAFLRARYDLAHTEAVGLCSGAYHAFKAAVAGLPLDGVVVVNPLVFFWKTGMSLAYPPYQMVQAAAQYQRSMFQATKWLKLLRSQRDISPIGHVVANRFAERARVILREVARALCIPLSEDLASELEKIGRRGVALRFLFSVGDPGEALLRVGAGSRLGWLGRRRALRVDHLDNCDHSLSSAWMHEAFWASLEQYLDGR